MNIRTDFYNKTKCFLLLSTIISFIRCNNHNQYKNNTIETSNSFVDTTTRVDTNFSLGQSIKYDTLYKDFFYEDTLRNGYRFGMTLSEWNRQLAILANNGIVKELSEIDFFAKTKENQYYVKGEYKGFISFAKLDEANSRRKGFFISGLFIEPTKKNDTVEIFRLNHKLINEPILIGLQLDCDIPSPDIVEVINVMVGKDNLEYLAGPDPITPNFEPITPADFSDPITERLRKFAKESGAKQPDENSVYSKGISKTLFQGSRFYSSIEVSLMERADVQRNSDYKVVSVSNASRIYELTQKLFSKKQFKLNIEDYMTQVQLNNFNDSINTKELINKTLH